MHALGEIIPNRCESAFPVVSDTAVSTIVQLFHELYWCVVHVQRYCAGAVFLYKALGFIKSLVHRIGLGYNCKTDHTEAEVVRELLQGCRALE